MGIELTAQTAGKYVLVTLVIYFITLGYSVYMAILNHKQAKVKDLMIENNQELVNIKCILKSIQHHLRK